MSTMYLDKLKLSLFGQSHGPAIGVVLDGLPAGEHLDLEQLARFMKRRAPGNTPWSTPRKEEDQPQFVAGLYQEHTCGTPLCALIANTNTRSEDYQAIEQIPRPGHADYTAWLRYGAAHDGRGGGHFSGRLTAPLCVAGGICLQILARAGITVGGHIYEICGVKDTPFDPVQIDAATLAQAGRWALPVLHQKRGAEMETLIFEAKARNDSLGGIVECAAVGLPGGLGGPLFAGLESKLAHALFGIPAVKGVEFGAGFEVARLKGSQNNDPYLVADGRIKTATNQAGGLLGGITTGMPLIVRAAFKPTPSISQPQQSVSLQQQQTTEINIQGRHDPCIVPRAVPVVEAVTAIVLLDELLANKAK